MTAYLAAVDARLQRVHRAGAKTFGAVLAAAHGADPQLVSRRLRELALPVVETETVTEAETETDDALPTWSPQLHALRSEWYFTHACAARLAAELGDGRVACLGAPTVAAAVSGAVLFDQDATTIRRRFGATIGPIVAVDLASANRLIEGTERFDAIVADPPWYAPHPHRWLSLAAAAVRPGGTIAMVVPPALQRPTAVAERTSLLAWARAVGPTSLHPDAVAYQTPLFESISMRAAGLTVPHAWRRADLVRIRVQAPPPPLAPVASPRPQRFDTFTIGEQLVMLSRNARPGSPALTAIAATKDYVWDAVSSRDPRIATIDLWTSRSRVATVHGRPAVHEALRRLAAGDAFAEVTRNTAFAEPLAQILG